MLAAVILVGAVLMGPLFISRVGGVEPAGEGRSCYPERGRNKGTSMTDQAAGEQTFEQLRLSSPNVQGKRYV